MENNTLGFPSVPKKKAEFLDKSSINIDIMRPFTNQKESLGIRNIIQTRNKWIFENLGVVSWIKLNHHSQIPHVESLLPNKITWESTLLRYNPHPVQKRGRQGWSEVPWSGRLGFLQGPLNGHGCTWKNETLDPSVLTFLRALKDIK